MYVIRTRNVHRALPQGLSYLEGHGVSEPSRNGEAIVAPGPVTTVYERPIERVLFHPGRDANPFFHFFEGLWMLAGRDDVGFLTNFVKRFADYSDDGKKIHGAYGYRWRNHFPPGDQLWGVINTLMDDPASRQAVIAMWDPDSDGPHVATRDRPCNTHIYLRVALGKANEPNRLNMMINCRSNDIIWGAYGANAVHFSFLQEYLAAHLGLTVGGLWQNSWNYHAYRDIFYKVYNATRGSEIYDPYADGEVKPYPLMYDPKTWDEDLDSFLAICDYHLNGGKETAPKTPPYRNPFFYDVARPLWWAHTAYKRGAYIQAFEIMEECKATDWRRAGEEWLARRRVSSTRRPKDEAAL